MPHTGTVVSAHRSPGVKRNAISSPGSPRMMMATTPAMERVIPSICRPVTRSRKNAQETTTIKIGVLAKMRAALVAVVVLRAW